MSRRDSLGRRLASLPVPDADGAAARAHAVVNDVFAARERPPVRRRRSTLRLALGVAGAALLAGAAAASPGPSTITRLVREAVAPKAAQVPIAPLRLPGGGDLLVRAPGALFVLHANGTHLLLGPYREAAWSPHARFVVATAGPHLVVIDPRTGTRHWSITAASTVHGARWSLEPTVPPCCRLAYLTDDGGRDAGTLHVIAGDGTGDHVLAAADARVAPAWQPGSRDRAIAFIDPSGRIRLVSADTGRALATPFSESFRPTALAWSADGQRLLALGPGRLIVLDSRLHDVVRVLEAGAGGPFSSAAFAGRGHAVVLLRRLGAGRSRVELVPAKGPVRPLETLVGTLAGLASSPDGRSVLVGWGAADQWLLIPTTRTGRTRRVAGLSSTFGSAPTPLAGAWHSTR